MCAGPMTCVWPHPRLVLLLSGKAKQSLCAFVGFIWSLSPLFFPLGIERWEFVACVAGVCRVIASPSSLTQSRMIFGDT